MNTDVPEEMLLRYARGLATPEEQRYIEEMMADDPFLSDAVEGMMKSTDHEQLVKNLQGTHDLIRRHAASTTKKIRPYTRWIQAAAAIMIVASCIWFINDRISRSGEKLFSEEFEPYPAPAPGAETSASDTTTVHVLPEIPTGDVAKPQAKTDNKPVQITRQEVTSATEDVTETAPQEIAGITSLADEQVAAPQDQTAVHEMTVTEEANQAAEQDQAVSGMARDAEKTVPAPASVKAGELQYSEKKQAGKEDAVVLNQLHEENPQLNKALALYQAGNYEAANKEFEKVLKADPDDEKAIFYAGVSYLAAGDADAAIGKLKRLEGNKTGTYYEASLWYQALAYIQKGEKKKAADYLEKITALNGVYRKQAEDLLSQL